MGEVGTHIAAGHNVTAEVYLWVLQRSLKMAAKVVKGGPRYPHQTSFRQCEAAGVEGSRGGKARKLTDLFSSWS